MRFFIFPRLVLAVLLLALGCNLEAATKPFLSPRQQTAAVAKLPTYQWRYQSSSDLKNWYWMALPPVVNTFAHCKLKAVGTWNTTLFIRLARIN